MAPNDERPHRALGPDPAARHAERLLGETGLARTVPERPEPLGPALEWAGSGAMALTGEADGPPRFASGGLATAARAAALALDALLPGAGFAALDAPALLGERAALFGFGRAGRTSCGGSARLLDVGRGAGGGPGGAALALNLPREDDWRLLEAWLEAPLGDAVAHRDWRALERALAAREPEALVERGREIGLAVALAGPRATPTCPSGFRLEHETRRARADGAPRAKVLDLSALWAGPLAGGLLAEAGCDVLKLESATRPDGARQGVAAFFDRLNGGKRGGTLDLSAARDREVFARLLDAADVVIESARPRALAQLGFDARAWVARRPGRLWASITGYGRDHEWIAFGDDAAVAAGLARDPDGAALRFCADAVADPLTGLYAAVAITGLRAQGRGGLLSLALADVAAHAARAGAGPESGARSGAPNVAPADGAVADPTGDRARADAGFDPGAGWTRPVRLREGRWAVLDSDRWHPVAPPRARAAAAGFGPALRPLEPALLAAWTAAC